MTADDTDQTDLVEIDDEPLSDRYNHDPSIGEIVVGAWREALEEDGIDRIVLVMLVFTLTIVVPGLFVLMLLYGAGVIA